ncbi:MAG: right-handed parallel beta-helix repeat-containing protein [Patescibacteria group bacterium]|jgi:parallel beta-helix repeat protein
MKYSKIIAILFFIFAPTAIVRAADTYYVDSSITDTNITSATADCTNYDPTTFACGSGTNSVYVTIADVNLKSFSAGDNIYFRKGQTWREQLTTKVAGTAGNQITYGSYGTGNKPRITGLDIVSGAAITGTANVYSKAEIATTPNVAVIDGVMGTEKDSLGALAANNDWYFADSTLYVYSTTDIAGKVVEAGVRDKVINSTKAYITIENLQLDGANHASAGAGVYLSGVGATGVVVNNCDIKFNLYGVLFFTTNAQAGAHTISNSTIHDNRNSGIHVNAGTDGSTDSTRTHIYNNQIYNNAGFGIFVYASYWLVENNTVYNNGDHTTEAGWSGIHIWGGASGSPTADTGHDNIVRYNTVYNTLSIGVDGSGIGVDMYADDNEIYYNVCYSNDGPGISLASDSGNVIYNNVAYGNNLNSGDSQTAKMGEIRVTGGTVSDQENFVIKNNIGYATADSAYAIYVDNYSYDNNPIITNNIWYAPNVMNWYLWNTSNPAVGTVWNNLTGVGTDLNSNPLFTNAASNDFTVLATSPAIDAGVDVNLTVDYSEASLYGTPDIGAHDYVPTYTQGTNLIDITSPFRIYTNGKFRYTQATSGSQTADFKVTPLWGSYDAASSSEFMNVTVDSWETTGNKNKQWTISSSVATTTIFTIGDLLASTGYTVKVDSSASSTIILGDTCTSAVCTSDGSGKIVFTYTGGWSSHTFNLEKVAVATPVATPSSTSVGGGSSSSVTLTPTVTALNSSGSNFSLSVNSPTNFSTIISGGSQQHSITLISIDSVNRKIILVIQSAPVNLSLNFEETKEVDLNNDGLNDIFVTFAGLNGNIVDIKIKPISATVDLANDLVKIACPAEAMADNPCKAVYYIGSDGKRYVFTDANVFKTWYQDFSLVKTIMATELAAYPVGGIVTYRPGVRMVKIQTDPKTYAVAKGGTLRWIKNEDLAVNLYGTQWYKMIDDISAAFFTNYKIGLDVSSIEDFNRDAAASESLNISIDKNL